MLPYEMVEGEQKNGWEGVLSIIVDAFCVVFYFLYFYT